METLRHACLDTTILVDLERGRQSAYDLIESLVSKSYRLVTTAVNVFEMSYGAHKSTKSEKNLEGLIALVEDLTIWDFNVESGLLSGKLLHEAELKGETIGFRDIFIASIALANGCQRVVTRNKKDFERIPGIHVITYE